MQVAHTTASGNPAARLQAAAALPARLQAAAALPAARLQAAAALPAAAGKLIPRRKNRSRL